MSVSPVTRRFMRWHTHHHVLADTVIALLVLALDIPIAIIPQHEELSLLLDAWPLILIPTWLLAGIAIALHRRYTIASWALVTATPALYLTYLYLQYPETRGYSYFVNMPVATITMAGIPLTLATLASRFPMGWAWAACAASTLVTAAAEQYFDYDSVWGMSASLSPYILLNIIGTLVGIALKFQRFQMGQLEERSARLSLAREQSMRLAAANERSRIAREMHDIVAHSLAVMITMADGAAAAVDRNPAMAKEALGVLAETGRSALADTRRLVGVLRDDPAASSAPASGTSDGGLQDPHGGEGSTSASGLPTASLASSGIASPAQGGILGRRRSAPSPITSSIPVVRDLPVPEFAPPGIVAPHEPSAPIAQLRRSSTDEQADTTTGEIPMAPAPEAAEVSVLVERFRAAGVPITYDWQGEPLPEDKGLQLTLFRIAQESLTNVLRYAPTTQRVEVRVARHTGAAVLTVSNDAAPGTTPMHGSGKGLIGMRERAAVYGGTVEAGPTPTGWQVRAVLRWDEDDEGASPWQLPH